MSAGHPAESGIALPLAPGEAGSGAGRQAVRDRQLPPTRRRFALRSACGSWSAAGGLISCACVPSGPTSSCRGLGGRLADLWSAAVRDRNTCPPLRECLFVFGFADFGRLRRKSSTRPQPTQLAAASATNSVGGMEPQDGTRRQSACGGTRDARQDPKYPKAVLAAPGFPATCMNGRRSGAIALAFEVCGPPRLAFPIPQGSDFLRSARFVLLAACFFGDQVPPKHVSVVDRLLSSRVGLRSASPNEGLGPQESPQNQQMWTQTTASCGRKDALLMHKLTSGVVPRHTVDRCAFSLAVTGWPSPSTCPKVSC